MIITILSFIGPVVIYVVSRYIARKLLRKSREADIHQWIVLLAALLYGVAWYVPSFPINGTDTAFMTHFLGGVVVGLLWLYFVMNCRVQMSWWRELAGLYALVSALGVLNELYELAAVQTGLADMSLNDTSWDLLANTLGALVFYIMYKLTYGRRQSATEA